MGSSTVKELANRRDPDNRARFWAAIRATYRDDATGWFTNDDIHRETYALKASIRKYLSALCKAGYVEKDAEARPIRYRLLRDPGRIAPRVRADGSIVTTGAARQNMWRSMRMLKAFTAQDLALTGTNADVQVSDRTARRFCGYLLSAGYLRVVTPNRGPHSTTTYRLIRNTGPHAPVIAQQDGQPPNEVYDPNRNESYTLRRAS